jgi:uncharacterized membrane protein
VRGGRGTRWWPGRWLSVPLAALLLLRADAALACAVCLSATDQTREAYYGTTVLLMLLPMLIIGVLGFWLRRAARAQRGAATLASGVEDVGELEKR